MFLIVEFPSTKEVEVVPSTWLKGDDSCYWPPKKASSFIHKYAERCHIPEDGWPIYKIRVLKSFSTYAEARQKLRFSEYTSDLTTDDEGPRKRRPNTRFELESLDSVDEAMPSAPSIKEARISSVPPISLSDSFSQFLHGDPDSPPKQHSPSIISNYQHYIPTPPSRTILPLTTPQPTHNQHYNVTSQAHTSLTFTNTEQYPETYTSHLPQTNHPIQHTSHAGPSNTQCTCTCTKHTYDTKLLKEIEKHMRSTTEALRSMQEQLNHLAAGTPVMPVRGLPPNFPIPLPVDSMEELDKLNDYLGTNANIANTASFLGVTGGRDRKQVVGNLLKRLLSNSLAKQLNWKGRGEKKAFQGYKQIVLLVFNAAKQHSNCEELTLLQTEDIIKTWLRFAADRDGGRENRKA